MIKIAHVISGLNMGGAEMMLYRFLAVYDKNQYSPIVISLTDIGPIGEKIKALGIPLYKCNMKKNFFIALFILLKILYKNKVDIIQTWMYHSDLFGGIMGRILNIPVVWGIHNSTLIKGKSKKTTMYIAKLNAYLSKFVPNKIICCSKVAQEIHEKLGYCSEKIEFIPNGFDGELFKQDKHKCQELRLKLKCKKEDFLIGMFARFDPQKDHYTLIQAAAVFFRKVSDAKLVLCGDGLDFENSILKEWIDQAGISDKVLLLGRRDDIHDMYKILDLFTLSSSFGEAFPLVVGEAMLTKVPCVVTDIGDASMLIGNTGRIIDPNNSIALANSWLEIYKMNPAERDRLGELARSRIKNNYGLDKIRQEYNNVYKSILIR